MSQFFTTENLKVFIQNNPDSLAFAHLGARLIDEGEYQAAIEVCQKGLEKHPEYSFGHFILGTAHYHVKNYTDAKKELERALAYDPNNPRAWEILSAINEILNLSDDSQESNLQSYLIDFLNKDASPQYIFEIDAPPTASQSEAETGTTQDTTPEQITTETVSQERDVGEMLDDVLAGSEEEYDFDKALDDVFKDKEEQATVVDKETEKEISQKREDATSEIVPSDKEGLVSAEEFTSAIESFFSDYEKEEDTQKTSQTKPIEKDVEPSNIKAEDDSTLENVPLEEIGDEGDTSEQLADFEEISEETTPTKTPEEDELGDSEDVSSPKKEVDEEFMDFQSFVSDVIQDTEEDIEIPKEEDFESPLPPIENQTESPEELTGITGESPGEPSGKEATAKFSKPPILSPTLGEIYIAQGRFEEAIDVFKQLLQKEPENSRFKRKINDLQNIITKKKLGS